MNYPIPGKIHRTEEIVRRSRFIATAAHADSSDAAKDFIARIRKEFPDATHNCWAFAAGPPAGTAQIGMSDDGEPHGTAGRPMLQILLSSGVGEIAVVVTRYFGGVKLGTGGLVRAYSSAVRKVLEEMPVTEKCIRAKMEIITVYGHHEAVRRAVSAFDGYIMDEIFGADVFLHIEVPEERMEQMIASLTDLSKGEILIERK
ncbi:MAG: YigZ family protein [Desulfococcaceae bacterium]